MIRVKVGSGLTIALPVGPIQLHKIEKQQHRRWSVGEEIFFSVYLVNSAPLPISPPIVMSMLSSITSKVLRE